VAGSIDLASIGSRANYGRSHCSGYIIRWHPKVSFSSVRFRGEYDQLSVADAVFVAKEAKEKEGERKARRKVAAMGFPSPMRADARTTLLCGHALARPLFDALDGSKFRVLARSVRYLGYTNVERRCQSGPGKRKLAQLSTDESNRPSPRVVPPPFARNEKREFTANL